MLLLKRAVQVVDTVAERDLRQLQPKADPVAGDVVEIVEKEPADGAVFTVLNSVLREGSMQGAQGQAFTLTLDEQGNYGLKLEPYSGRELQIGFIATNIQGAVTSAFIPTG